MTLIDFANYLRCTFNLLTRSYLDNHVTSLDK